MALFTDTNFGDRLLQVAQGIVANEQRNQQILLERERFEEQKKQNDSLLDARRQEIELREKNLELQTQQEQRQQAIAGLRAEQITAETAFTEARTRQLERGGPSTALTGNKRVAIQRQIINQAVGVETSAFIDSYNQRNNTGVPSLTNPTEVDAERRRLRKILVDFQKSPQAAGTRAFAAESGQTFQIDTVANQLKALDGLVKSPEWAEFRARLRDEGPSLEMRAQVRDRFFGEFADQIDVTNEGNEIKPFDYGKIPVERIESGWQLFEEGNVDVLADVILEATGGTFDNRLLEQIDAEATMRTPQEGPAQDEARANYLRLLETINTRRDR